MQNFISSISLSKSFQFVNDQLCWEEHSPHRHDCHDPPQGGRVGLQDERSSPQRLPAVARSDPWKVTPAEVGFPGDTTRWRRLPWVGGSDRRNMGRGKDCLRRDLRGEDCDPEQEFMLSLVYRRPGAHLQLRAFFLPQDDLASFRNMARTSSWSRWLNFLKVSTSLPSREEGAAPVATGTVSGSLSPSKNSWYVSISSAFANLSRVSRLGTVCPFSTLEI